MSRIVPDPDSRSCEASPRVDRRLFIGLSGGFCLTVGSVHAGEIEPEAFIEYGEPFDANRVARGDWMIVHVDGQPIFVRRRTTAEIEAARTVPLEALPDPARDEDRAPDPQWIVVSGVCTHAGCTVSAGLGPYRGWMCLCHGSIYDLSGRVRHGPAKKNLAVIPHRMNSRGEMVLSAS